MPFQYTSTDVAFLIHSFLSEGNVLAHPFGENYSVYDAKVDPDNDGLIKIQMLYKREKREVRTLAYNGPIARFLLSQIPSVQVAHPDLPEQVYTCEDYLGIYTGGNPHVQDIEPLSEEDFEIGRAYLRVLGYVHNLPLPQLCRATRQIDEYGKKERVVLSPMQDTLLYTEILIAYLTCQRTQRRKNILEAKGKTSRVYMATKHLYPFLLPGEDSSYTPYLNLGDIPNGTHVAFLHCVCQQCQFYKHTSNGGPGRNHVPGGYNWGNLYSNCGTYAANEHGKYCWVWETERVRPASIVYAKGPILASPFPPVLQYETGNFQVGAWISLWRQGDLYVGIVQSVIEKHEGTIAYGERRDVQTSECDTLEQAETAARTLWTQIEQQC